MKNQWVGSEEHIKQVIEAGELGRKRIEEQKEERIKKYNVNPILCKQCERSIPYERKKRNAKFCNSSCSATYRNTGRKRTDLERERISKGVKEKAIDRIKSNDPNTIIINNKKEPIKYRKVCPHCKENYESKKSSQKYCSVKCTARANGRNPILKEINRRAQLKLVKEGRHQGWKSRTKKPSYAEQYFIDLFHNEGINGWEREYKVGKYFIDFAFIDKKIALEIDGKQHRLCEDRIERDKNKDIMLVSDGWRVIRINWYNPISNANKKKLYSQISNFIEEI